MPLELDGQYVSDNINDRLFFEIFEKNTRVQIAELEKKENDVFELYLIGAENVNAQQFIQLIQFSV